MHTSFQAWFEIDGMFRFLNVVSLTKRHVVFREDLNVLVLLPMDDHYALAANNHFVMPIFSRRETKEQDLFLDPRRKSRISFYSIISIRTSSIVMFVIATNIEKFKSNLIVRVYLLINCL